MSINQWIGLITPLIGVLVGIMIKVSASSQLRPVKKLWLVFVIAGGFVFIARLMEYLN